MYLQQFLNALPLSSYAYHNPSWYTPSGVHAFPDYQSTSYNNPDIIYGQSSWIEKHDTTKLGRRIKLRHRKKVRIASKMVGNRRMLSDKVFSKNSCSCKIECDRNDRAGNSLNGCNCPKNTNECNLSTTTTVRPQINGVTPVYMAKLTEEMYGEIDSEIKSCKHESCDLVAFGKYIQMSNIQEIKNQVIAWVNEWGCFVDTTQLILPIGRCSNSEIMRVLHLHNLALKTTTDTIDLSLSSPNMIKKTVEGSHSLELALRDLFNFKDELGKLYKSITSLVEPIQSYINTCSEPQPFLSHLLQKISQTQKLDMEAVVEKSSHVSKLAQSEISITYVPYVNKVYI